MSGSTQATLAPLFGAYDTAELVQVVQNLKVPSTFLLDMFFPNIVESDTPLVAIDVDNGKRRLAPFCSPLVEGKVVEPRQYQTNFFKPAYIKDKRVPDLTRPVRRVMGERLLGAMTPAERAAKNIQFELEDALQMINRRMEWMAAQALLTSQILVKGEGYATPEIVNFGRSAANTVSLTGSAAWGQAGVSPSSWVQQWSTQVLQESGAPVTDLVFTNSPWAAWKADINVFNSIYVPRGGDSTIELGGQTPRGGAYMGRWGQYRLWIYNEWYVDPETDTEQPMLPDGTVLLVSDQLQGLRSFGAILDPKFNYGALAFAPKMWAQEDPAQLILMVQSAPLVIPSRVNSSFAATVMPTNGTVQPIGF